MSAEHHPLTAAAGLHGKHPAFGDFVAAGLPQALDEALARWLQETLGAWRAGAGGDWQAVFDAAPRVSFWIGGALLGGTALRGVWQPSRDRSGRRYPLLLAQCGGAVPLADPQAGFDETAATALAELGSATGFEPRDIAERLGRTLPPPPPAGPGWPTFWALNARRDAATLLQEIAAQDHAHAAACRSYWWFGAGTEGAGVLACQSWPGPAELDWLIRHGRPAPALSDGAPSDAQGPAAR